LFFGNGFIKYDKSNETKGGTNGWGRGGHMDKECMGGRWGKMGGDVGCN
jgi:hypothetical protein